MIDYRKINHPFCRPPRDWIELLFVLVFLASIAPMPHGPQDNLIYYDHTVVFRIPN